MLKAGFASIDITPPVGAILTGFIARPGPSTGVDLPLFARVLWMESSRARCLLVALDLLGLGLATADLIVTELAKTNGCNAEEVVLTSTHTHAGPCSVMVRGIGSEDPEYMAMVRERLGIAATRARAAAAPVTAAWVRASVSLGINRRVNTPAGMTMGRNPDGPNEPFANVLLLRGGTRPIVVVEHACHPYCVPPSLQLISQDYCGYAMRDLHAAGFDGMFLNGCAGDIAPRRGNEGVAAAEAEGRRLAEATITAVALSSIDAHTSDDLWCGSTDLDLAHDRFPGLDHVKTDLGNMFRVGGKTDESGTRIRVEIAFHEWLHDLEHALRGRHELPPVRVRVSLLRIAGGALAVLPGEPFCRIGQEIASRITAANVAVAGYGHGFFGYVPTPDAFPLGGYEVDEAHRFLGLWRVAPDSAARLIDAAARLWETSTA